jgi:rubrerythrin
MNTNIRVFAAAFCVQWLIGCAVNFQPPPLSASNPASVQAKESVTPPAKPMLGRDAITEKTNERLATNAETNPSFQPPEMQQMHHDMKGMEGTQHDESGAMKMDSDEKEPGTGKFYYTCKMHPQVHQEKPGKCPICGMTLIKKGEK